MRENELSAWQMSYLGDMVRCDHNNDPIATVCEGDGWYSWQVFAPSESADPVLGDEASMIEAHEAADTVARQLGWVLA